MLDASIAWPTPPPAQELVSFWANAGRERWFSKDPAFDAELKQRFLALHEQAALGELDDYLDTPTGSLALVLLLDQFPRNAFRGTPRMFDTDLEARMAADRALARGHDERVPDALRVFFYLPFEHSEDLADQERSVDLQDGMAEQPWAIEHRDIIRRFGRFPHRNAVLGRESSAEEEAFLAQGGFGG
jgi:uncharacterized protein (DUF924 family)